MRHDTTPMNSQYIRMGAVTPKLKIGDVKFNVGEITRLAQLQAAQNVEVIAFPELSITGYTAGDMFENTHLLKDVEDGLVELAIQTSNLDSLIIVGAPISVADKLYNCAVVLAGGIITAVIPKSYLPNYKEFYEKRWFVSGKDIADCEVKIGHHLASFGTDILIELDQATLGIEICEDLWVPTPPSIAQAEAGANIIVNISASNELIGKAPYRRSLVAAHSARIICGYMYVSCGVFESSADVVFSGHNLIAANGRIEKESQRFQTESNAIISDIDMEHLSHDRRVNTSFESTPTKDFRRIKSTQPASTKKELFTSIDPHPFVPSQTKDVNERAEEIMNIQAHGLATQLRNASIDKVVLGLSGGLDSTLALLVAVRAMDVMGLSQKNITTITMPGYASSDRTQSNATKLAKAIGTTHLEIPIKSMTSSMLKALDHDGETQDITYENAQARTRTEILMNYSNKNHSLVLGTGDLSEIALGWCTFNGDHMSMYNVNCSVPKTLVRHLVRWASAQPNFKDAKVLLADILDTPVSPELKDGKDGIGQRTEDLIGPYELHDFFLYNLVRHGDGKRKILQMAEFAFEGAYTSEEISKWLDLFAERFTKNQFKRESAPNGPKVGTVSLSQRGDWRMPPGASINWL